MLINVQTLTKILQPNQIIDIQGYGEYRVKNIPDDLMDIKIRYIKHNIDCIEVFIYD